MYNALPEDVESMAQTSYDPVNGTPWEKVGISLPRDATVQQTLILANLDWNVMKAPLSATVDEENALSVKVPDSFALIRDTDKEVLTPYVGSSYKPVQNEDAFTVFQDFVAAGNMTMETAGSLRKGKHIWGLAVTQGQYEIASGEILKGYFLLVQSHKYGHSLRAMFTPIRYPGGHTMVQPINTKGRRAYTMPHSRIFNEERVKEIKQLMGLAEANLREHFDNAKFLSTSPISEGNAIRYLAEVFDPKLYEKIEEKDSVMPMTLRDLASLDAANRSIKNVAVTAPSFFEKETDSCQGTAWGYYNLVAHVLDKVAGRSVDTRLESSWFGPNAKKKVAAFNSALAYASMGK